MSRAARISNAGACLAAALALFTGTTVGPAAPVQFAFSLPPSDREPLAREVSAEVVAPSGARRDLPAFLLDESTFAVRTTPDEAGTYRLGPVRELVAGVARAIEPRSISPASREILIASAQTSTLAFIRRDARDPARFSATDGTPYVPIGMNLAWAGDPDVVGHYERRFAQLRAAGLNWTRIWMCHWGGLNPDWLRDANGPSPSPGTAFDERVAQRWDRIVDLAEQNGIRLQFVLQHHGQFSTRVNPNWPDHPWNAANPDGFLAQPSDFFTSERARELTRRKYRHVVARWGYSPAVLAWELFNEVHWVDAIRLEQKEATVAAWHDEMAAWLRAVDAHHHLVTTSTDDVRSPIYRSMDFLQPHLYARNMLAAVRDLPHAPDENRPVFFGEIGDDHLPISPEQKQLSRGTMPPVWSGLMGTGRLPPQIWYGDRLLDAGQSGEIAALARFLAATRLCERDGLQPFLPGVESMSRIPLRVHGTLHWRPRPPAVVEVLLDGSEPRGLEHAASHLVRAENRASSGYPDAITIRLDYPHAAVAQVRLGGAGAEGSEARVLVDGVEVARHTWPSGGELVASSPADLRLQLAAGPRTIEIRNVDGPDWFEFIHFDSGLDAPVIGALGKRSDDFVALWLWHREDIYALAPGPGASGFVTIDDLPAGTWSVTWWNTLEGIPVSPTSIQHTGGSLRLETPPVSRHAAVVLSR